MPPKGQSPKQPPPDKTKSTPSTRRVSTRSTNKAAEPTTVDTGTQKRKAKDPPPVDQLAKRPNKKGLNTKQTHPPTDVEDAAEPPAKVTVETRQDARARKWKPSTRTVPARPTLSSDSESEDDNLRNQITDGGATSPLPSDDEVDDPPTATQLIEEHPRAAGTTIRNEIDESCQESNAHSSDDGERITVNRPNVRSGKRVERIIREVPAPGPSFQQPDNPPADTRGHDITTVDHQSTHLFPNPSHTGFMQPMRAWPAFTNLIQDSNGSYKQTGQTVEINNCLSAAVKQANSHLVLIDSFPGVEQQEQWLADALTSELCVRSQTPIIKAVGERARVDIGYFNTLLSMIQNRWSGYRQSALNVARDLTGTRLKGKPSDKSSGDVKARAKAKPSYGLSGSDAENVAAATKLLEHDAFHFGRTSSGAPDSTVPYQRRELLFMLAYFFKCDPTLKDRVPTGKGGPEIPKSMVALASTLIEVALSEVVEGKRLRFSEENQRERYIGHLDSLEQVRISKDGDRKLARLLSDIYTGTMNELSSKRVDRPAPGAPTRPTLMNTDLMPV